MYIGANVKPHKAYTKTGNGISTRFIAESAHNAFVLIYNIKRSTVYTLHLFHVFIMLFLILLLPLSQTTLELLIYSFLKMMNFNFTFSVETACFFLSWFYDRYCLRLPIQSLSLSNSFHVKMMAFLCCKLISTIAWFRYQDNGEKWTIRHQQFTWFMF